MKSSVTGPSNKSSITISSTTIPESEGLEYSAIESQIKFLQGKVLTVIDASYSDTRQLKAVKDLVNKMFSEQLTWILQLCYKELPIQSREQVKESGVDVDEVERTAEDLE